MNNNLYKTTDMSLAVVISMRYTVKELQNIAGRGVFIFDNSPELQEMVDAFYNHQLTVDPLTLFEAQKTIKNRLYSQVKGQQ
jgi:hypothetical protein